MPRLRSTVLVAAAAAGLALGGFFLAGRTVAPPAKVQTPAGPATASSPATSSTAATSSTDASPNVEAPPPRSVRTIPFKNTVDSSPMTTGGPVQEPAPPPVPPAARDSQAAAPEGGDDALSCNVDACSRKYRSFEHSTCTYKPYGGGPRQRCEK